MKNSLGSVELAQRIRLQSLRMVHAAKSSHIGSCLSMADMLAVLYSNHLAFRAEEPDWPLRDKVVISKGHAAAAVYAVLAEVGYFPKERLAAYGRDGQPLAGHVSHTGNPGVELSSGSLGHGLSVAAGFALAMKHRKASSKAVAVLSDGECDEGSIWEAALFAAHHKLANLIALIDYNKIQSFGRVEDVLNLEPFADKWRAFGWSVTEVDGHVHADLDRALAGAARSEKPSAIICHTVKGKGVSFMEDKLIWHYKSPNDEELALAERELIGST